MFSLIKTLLNGITNMTYSKSGKREFKMLNFTTKIPALDEENSFLFIASELLESLGNLPGLTADQLSNALIDREIPAEQYESIALAAVSIEAMMSVNMINHTGLEPTVH